MRKPAYNNRKPKPARTGPATATITDVPYGTGIAAYVTEYDPEDFSQVGSILIHQRIRDDRDVTNGVPVNTYRAYARGRHKLTLTDKQKILLRSLLGNKFCDNICGQVLESSSSRLDVQRLQCENEDTQKWLESWFVTADLKSKARKIHFAALRDGNTILAVSWSNKNKKVCLYAEDWWNGRNGVFVAYNDEGEIVYGVKEWIVRAANVAGISNYYIRRNIWFPDRLEKWTGNGVEWQKLIRRDEYGSPVWPEEWTDKAGDPLGVPYVHFANSGKGEDTYGISDIDEAVGLNDQLNDLQYAMTTTGRLTGYQMYYASGVTDEDEDGSTSKKKEYEVSPGKIFILPPADARMGVLAAGDVDKLIALYDKKQATVAIRTRTPMSEITNTPSGSGEALYQAQQPAIGKAQENIDKWTPRWSQVAYMAVKVFNAFSEGEPELTTDEETAMVVAVMSPADRRDKLTMSVIVMNLGDVVSNKEKLRLLGYSPEQIEAIMQEKSEEAQQDLVNAMNAFNRGTGKGTELPGTGPDKGAAGGIGPNDPAPGATRNQETK